MNVPNDARHPTSSKNSGDSLIDNAPGHGQKGIAFDDKTPHSAETAEITPYDGEPPSGSVKIIAEAKDIVTTILHVEDDVSLNPWTFRMFLIGKPGISPSV